MVAFKYKTALLAAILATSKAAAQADVITFENLVPINGGAYLKSSFTPLPGYSISNNVSTGLVGFDSGYGTQASNIARDGTDIIRSAPGSTTTLTSTVDSVFSVNSIDLANCRVPFDHKRV